MKTNFLAVASTEISGITTSLSKEINGLSECTKAKITISWASLTGTLDAKIEVFQRTSSDGEWYLWDAADSVKVLSTAAGTWTFEWPDWTDNDIKVVFTKNGCTGGTFKVSCGLR